MEIKLIIATTLFVSFAFLGCNVDAEDFDISKYGAKSGKDISEAVKKAWKGACDSKTASKVMIGSGTWYLSQVKVVGPCKAPIDLEVKGTVRANQDPDSLPDPKGEWITINYVDDFNLYGGGVFDGRGQTAWKLNDCNKNSKCAKRPLNLSFNFIKNAVIKDVTTKDSKNFHVNLMSSSNVTFQRFTVSAPDDSVAPNTDGLHIARSKKVKVLDSVIKTGDDCVSVGDETDDLRIENITCGPGHGISIGSLGKTKGEKDVKGVHVKNVTFIGTQNGVRIKTWPQGPATLTISDISFEDLIMKDANNPIMIDQEYCPSDLCEKGKSSNIKIDKVTIKNVKGTSASEEAVILVCSTKKPCGSVTISDVDLKYSKGKISSRCANVKPKISGTQSPKICAEEAKTTETKSKSKSSS